MADVPCLAMVDVSATKPLLLDAPTLLADSGGGRQRAASSMSGIHSCDQIESFCFLDALPYHGPAAPMPQGPCKPHAPHEQHLVAFLEGRVHVFCVVAGVQRAHSCVVDVIHWVRVRAGATAPPRDCRPHAPSAAASALRLGDKRIRRIRVSRRCTCHAARKRDEMHYRVTGVTRCFAAWPVRLFARSPSDWRDSGLRRVPVLGTVHAQALPPQ
jgi:hypothetical protein